MTLTQLVSQEKWQEFDQAWTELQKEAGPIEDLVSALQIAGDRKRLPRCLPMIKDHAASLLASDRAADAARLLGVAVSGGGAPGELMPSLVEAAQKAWGSESWWGPYTEIARFTPENGNGRAAWTAFERLIGFEQKRLVYHRGGWGVGEVTEVNHDALEIGVRFANGRKDRFPVAGAVDIFELLPDEDLRALHFRDPDAMRKLLRQDPLAVLRAVLERHGGRATNAAIKNALLQVGVEGSAWSGWWRKTRKIAEESEWFKVTGTPARGEVQVLRSAVDPVTDLKRRLEAASSLSDLLARVRDMFSSGPGDARVRSMALEVLDARSQNEREPLADRFAAWLVLRDERGASPAPLSALLASLAPQKATDATSPPPLWARFQSLGSLRDQERCVGALKEAYGATWADEGTKHFQHAPPGMARVLLEALIAEGKQAELGAHYNELLARPIRSPEALLQLARAAEGGRLTGNFPPPVQRAEALLSLASYLFVNKKADPILARAQTRLVEFLCKGRDPLLRRLLTEVDPTALDGLQRALQRGVDEEIDRLLTTILARVSPPVSEADAAHFWEGDRIWTTREGLERRRAEFRVLREEKIPANQDAIGKAAAMGDLSENSEWEMAIQEQRNLTQRASEIEAELRLAELIENAILPEDTVCPGSFVRYRDLENASEHEISILGPWDTDRESVVSYRAPLAAGLLGRHPGERAKIKLPSGVMEVEVLAARPAELG
ncbi:MAG TPA: GreA/GreB family elongation factor [Planctomycetota bacterium]|nr:GreA/GreB family elongation factor [Planctomycetota bacterium]